MGRPEVQSPLVFQPSPVQEIWVLSWLWTIERTPLGSKAKNNSNKCDQVTNTWYTATVDKLINATHALAVF